MNKLKIGNIELENDLLLAPMAGYSDVGLRYLAKKYGAALTCTEMISAKALMYGNKKTLDLLATFEGEHPCSVQLFGNDPEVFYKAIKSPVLDKFDIIDINMGCPAPKIFNNGEGSALLNKMELAGEIVKACKRATDRPVTVKIRSGIDDKSVVAKQFAVALQNAGADAIILHARTKEQGYAGKVNYQLANEVKQALKIPLIVSGDCVDLTSYRVIKEQTGADGVMIGRAAIGHPEIFAEILGNNQEIDKLADIKKHIEILLKFFSERYVVLNMRSHLAHYIKGRKVKAETKLKLMNCQSVKEILTLLKEIFE